MTLRHALYSPTETMEELSRKAYTKEAAQKLKAYHPNEWIEEDQQRVDE